jgi:hypothetical protein
LLFDFFCDLLPRILKTPIPIMKQHSIGNTAKRGRHARTGIRVNID